MTYVYHLVVYCVVYGIAASGLNVVSGHGGLLSLAAGASFGLGCYVYALSSRCLGVGFVGPAMIAVLAGSAVSLAVSLPSRRLRGDGFVIATLAMQVAVVAVIQAWRGAGANLCTLANMTNGPFGITGIARPVVFGHRFQDSAQMAVFAACCGLVIFILLWALTSSAWGRKLRCMRDDEEAFTGIGGRPGPLKAQAFGIACATTAFAGCLYASYVGFIDPGCASLEQSFLVLSMLLLGGVGSLSGPWVGACVMVLIPEALRMTGLPASAAASASMIILGLLLMGLMHFRPQGIAGLYRVE
jgi:branched-chain amino acid transport system permease protein